MKSIREYKSSLEKMLKESTKNPLVEWIHCLFFIVFSLGIHRLVSDNINQEFLTGSPFVGESAPNAGFALAKVHRVTILTGARRCRWPGR